MATSPYKTKYQANDRYELDSIIDQLRREFHQTLDLNYPMVESTPIEIGGPSQPPLQSQQFQNPIVVRDPMHYSKNNGFMQMEMMMNEEEKAYNIDLSLGLSLTTVPQQQEVPPKQFMELSSSSSQRSCMSLDINSSESSGVANMEDNEVPSLILKGCTYCLMYVMVSEVDPKCPKCMSPILIDMFRQNPAKRPRKF